MVRCLSVQVLMVMILMTTGGKMAITIDINGAVEISGTTTQTGVSTSHKKIYSMLECL